MCHRFLSDPRFFSMLARFDDDLAEAAREKGCDCGGRLHQANYPRKPRGGPESFKAVLSLRLSFCCGSEGCRRRATPPSLRFLGRKVYLGVVIVLVTALRQGPTPRGTTELKQRFGVDRRTIARWQDWWAEVFPRSAFWRSARARIARLPEPLELPLALIDVFGAQTANPMAGLLRFLSPIGASGGLAMQAF